MNIINVLMGLCIKSIFNNNDKKIWMGIPIVCKKSCVMWLYEYIFPDFKKTKEIIIKIIKIENWFIGNQYSLYWSKQLTFCA